MGPTGSCVQATSCSAHWAGRSSDSEAEVSAIGGELSSAIRHKALSFEEYWLASKAWERCGVALGPACALVNAGFLTVDDLRAAPDLELAAIPRVGAKSLAILFGLMGREMPTVTKEPR